MVQLNSLNLVRVRCHYATHPAGKLRNHQFPHVVRLLMASYVAPITGSRGSLNINDPLPPTQILNLIQHKLFLDSNFMLSPISPYTTQLGRRLCVSEFVYARRSMHKD